MSLADGGDSFPFVWEHEADPERSWEWDDMHMPVALTPLAEDYVRVLGEGFNLVYELNEFPQRIYCRVWNGYAYFANDPHLPEPERAANEARWHTAQREAAKVTERFWTDEVLPEIREIETRLRAIPTDALEPADLAAAWDNAWADVGRMWKLHFLLIRGPYAVTEDLVDLYETLVPGAPPGEALRLIQGTEHELLETELGMERLAAIASANPAIAAALTAPLGLLNGAATSVSAADLESLEGGTEFVAEFNLFLDRHGHLGQPYDDLHLPSWAEEPSIVLAQLGSRLAIPPEPASQRRARLAADAAGLADRVRARLSERPEDLARFEELLVLARTIGPLTEVHNYWIDRMAQARIRAHAVRVAGRLVANGSLADPGHVFFLRRREVRDLILQPRDATGLIRDRQAEHDRRLRMQPPRRLGTDRPDAKPDRFDGARIASDDVNVLLGTGASAGVARGPARVAMGPADFGRIRPGDIIVCPSSNPSWVPLFTIAAGLITNTGGVLSHAAVVAREFALPAVVGTGDATTRIRDGRLVEIDGSTGSVRLL